MIGQFRAIVTDIPGTTTDIIQHKVQTDSASFTFFDSPGLLDFTDELEAALGKKVDVVFIGSQMHDYFRQQLEEDMIKLCLGQKKKA